MMSLRRKAIFTNTVMWATLLLAADTAFAEANEPNLTLRGDQDGTVFRSLTVEGENRVQIHFERPQLNIDVDPTLAPGLALNDALNILDRTLPDLVKPFLDTSIAAASNYVPRPWVTPYQTGAVARFTPDLDRVAQWKLQIVDSRGRTAMLFVGQGRPAGLIAWDGLRLDGTPAPPGYTYSYVLTAQDDAGNQRRFVGDGFELSSFRRDDAEGPEFLASGAAWAASLGSPDHISPLSLAAASGINLRCEATRPVRIIATHRTMAAAEDLAARVADSLKPLIIGDSSRIIVEPRLENGAPAAGTVRISAKPARETKPAKI